MQLETAPQTINPQAGSSELQAPSSQSVQSTPEASGGAGQSANSAASVLQSPANNRQTELFLRGETAGGKVAGNGEWMPPAVSAVLAVLGLVICAMLVVLLVRRLQAKRRSV